MSALPVPARVVLSSKQSGAIYKDVLQVASADYKFLLRRIAAEETAAQKAIGNPPFGALVDGSRTKNLADVERSVVVWFADRRMLGDAIVAARDELARLGRKVTGETIGALRFFASEGAGGSIQPVADPRATAAASTRPTALDLYVALPVVHVRAWQWFSASGARAKRRTRNKKLTRYARATKQKPIMVSRSVFETAAAVVQRRFKSLDVLLVYFDVPNLNRGPTPVDRIPAIKVRMKVRGRGK